MAKAFSAGSSQYITASSAPATAVPLTIACWFWCNDVTNVYNLVSLEDSSVNMDYFRLSARGNAGDVLSAQSHDGTTGVTANASGTYTSNTWHHACGVYASTTSRQAFLNGSGGTAETTSNIPSGIDSLNIGRLNWDGTPIQYLDGKVAEVGIWDVALTQGEITSLANGVSPQFIRPQSLAFYAPLVGNASPEQDLSGGISLTVSGATKSEHSRIIKPSAQILRFPPVAAGGGRIMGSLAGLGGLAGHGGIAGPHGGMAG